MLIPDEFADELPVGIFRIDRANRYQYVNRRAAELIGRPAAEVVGRTLFELTSNAGLEATVRAYSDQVFATGRPTEYQIANPVDATGHLLVKLVPGVGANGRAESVLGVITDVTAMKRAERGLREAEERHRRVVNAARVVAWRVDLVADRVEYDPEYLVWIGLTPETAPKTGTDWLAWYHPDDLAGMASALAAAESRPGRVFEYEFRAPMPDGSVRWFLVRGTTRDGPDGRPAERIGTSIDVTDRRRAEERLRRAMDAARVCTWDYDAVGGRLRIDPELWHWLGLDPAAAPQTADAWVTWLHPEDVAGRAAAFAALEAGAEVAEYDFRATAADGSVHWFRVRAGAHRRPDGRILRAYGAATEVTDRKRDELARHEAEERFRSAADTAPAMLWITDPADACTFRSRGWYEFTGQTPADGRPDAVHPADREAVERAFAEATAARRPFACDYRLRRADGEFRWVIDAGHPWIGSAGEFRGYVGSVIDIEDRKRAELATRLSEQRFTEFLNHLPANGWVKDADGRYLFVNQTALQTYGVAANHFVGRTDRELFPADVADTVRAHDADVIATGRPVRTQEVIPARATGGARNMTVVKFPVTGPDGRPAVGGIGLDITDQVRATERAVQAQKLESLGVLAGGIAHDFNNILTAVLGYASLAKQETAGTTAVADYLTQIETAAQRAGELCAQMLAYAGKGRQTSATVDLSQLVREMAQLLSAAIGKSAVLRYQFADDLPPVTVDATQVRQVVMNLITNAADAIGEKSGVITLTTGVLDADERYLAELGAADLSAGRYVSLEVSDTGCGMTAETADRVFEPFFTTKFTGRGLGLSAVRGILKQHRGAIKVYSAVGQGTTFKVLLPQAADAAPARPPSAAAVIDQFGEGRLILVVDDEEALRVFARRLLERVGFTVEVAPDGRAGLEAFRRRPAEFAAVLLDLTMPHLDGADTFRELRRVRADVPVVLSSGFGKDDATAGLEGKGLAGFVRKPFRVQELLGTLRTVLGPPVG